MSPVSTNCYCRYFSNKTALTVFQKRREKSGARNTQVGEKLMDNLDDDEKKVVLIFDTGGGWNGTITKRAWYVFEYYVYPQELRGYQDISKGNFYPTVNAVTKAKTKDRNIPVLLVNNYETMIDYKRGWGGNLLLSNLR